MSTYTNGHIYYMLWVFCVESDHRTKSSVLWTFKISQGEVKIWHHHVHYPWSQSSCFDQSFPSNPLFSKNQRRVPLNLSAGLRKTCMWLKGKYTSASHFCLRSHLPSIHDNSKTTTDFSHAAQAHCKISIKLFTTFSNIPQYLEQAEKCLNSSVSSK